MSFSIVFFIFVVAAASLFSAWAVSAHVSAPVTTDNVIIAR